MIRQKSIRSSYTDTINFFGNTNPFDLVKEFDTPLYVYNEQILRNCCKALKNLSAHPNFIVSYSAKANSNLTLLKIIKDEGLCVDAMSPGEIFLNEQAGFKPEQIFYVSNNVSAKELEFVISRNILPSIDSLSQLELLGKIKPGNEVMIRFNPGIGAGHHGKVITAGKTTKFGVNPDDLELVKQTVKKYNLKLVGINQHIGSLFLEPQGYLDAVDFLLNFSLNFLADLKFIDFGGGFGIPYHKYENQARLDLNALNRAFEKKIDAFCTETNYQGSFIIEPGRFIAAESGLLLGLVTATKNNAEINFIGTDIGFNVLARPVLYDSFHDIEIYRNDSSEANSSVVGTDTIGATTDTSTATNAATEGVATNTNQDRPKELLQTIVGNICESGDILAKDRLLPEIMEGDIIGVLDAGAYGFVMSSNYNLRLRPAEVLIDLEGNPKLIRRREKPEDLLNCF